jgi:hypothetical protein
VKWELCADDARYFNNAEVYVTIPDVLWDYFNAQSMPGSGWIPDTDNHIIVIDPCAVLGPILIPDTISSALGFTWRYKPGTPLTGSMGKVLFELVQKTDDIETGRTFYGLETVISGSGEHSGDAPILADFNESDTISRKQGLLNISPNPFTHFLDIKYNCEVNVDVRIDIVNI